MFDRKKHSSEVVSSNPVIHLSRWDSLNGLFLNKLFSNEQRSKGNSLIEPQVEPRNYR
jgi:hypothetical protein